MDEFRTQYCGYVDEVSKVESLGWNYNYENRDFDGDGLRDRVYIERWRQDEEGENYNFFRIEFGDGSMLKFEDYEVSDAFLIQGADLTEYERQTALELRIICRVGLYHQDWVQVLVTVVYEDGEWVVKKSEPLRGLINPEFWCEEKLKLLIRCQELLLY